MDYILTRLPDSPIVEFTILLLVTLVIPPIFERLRLPGLIGLLFAGILLGSDGLGLLDRDSEMMSLLSDIGKVYLMFVAGLEIDLADFRKSKERSLGFGVASFLIPLGVGALIGWQFGYGWNAAILIGSLFASHTLLGYPIAQQMGVVKNESVTITIGATIFTDITALLVLAICVSIHAGDFSWISFGFQFVSLGVYAALVLFGLDWAGNEFFRRTGDEESNQFLFILFAVFLTSIGAQLINVDMIVGAFLAGLAVNDVVGRSPVEQKIQFVGSALFIPFFFIGTGLLVDIQALMDSLTTNVGFTVAIAGEVFVGKFIAASAAKLAYRYTWNEALMMWSLSLPQVAATLAAALTGLQVGLLDDSVFNSVIVMMLATALVGPLLTRRFAARISAPASAEINPTDRHTDTVNSIWHWHDSKSSTIQYSVSQSPSRFTIMLPISKPSTARDLMEMASRLAHEESGEIIPLAITPARVPMDEPELESKLWHTHQLLNRAEAIGQDIGVPVNPLLRIDDDIAEGISRAAREQNADLIMMGWSHVGLRSRLFGSITESVVWLSHCPVAVARLLDKPSNIRKILVPVKTISPRTLKAIQFAQLIAKTNGASVTIFHVVDQYVPLDQVSRFESDLTQAFYKKDLELNATVEIKIANNVIQAILNATRSVDLVILRSLRRRTAGGLSVSDVTTNVIKDIRCSLILFGEPHA
ncbi:MAG: cation:proton antiporter [Elainellaceae cyanobacterium]